MFPTMFLCAIFYKTDQLKKEPWEHIHNHWKGHRMEAGNHYSRNSVQRFLFHMITSKIFAFLGKYNANNQDLDIKHNCGRTNSHTHVKDCADVNNKNWWEIGWYPHIGYQSIEK